MQAESGANYVNPGPLKATLLGSAKMQIYKTLIGPVVSYYGGESWTLTEDDKEILRRFEWKVNRKIYGGVKVGEAWRIHL